MSRARIPGVGLWELTAGMARHWGWVLQVGSRG